MLLVERRGGEFGVGLHGQVVIAVVVVVVCICAGGHAFYGVVLWCQIIPIRPLVNGHYASLVSDLSIKMECHLFLSMS